MLEISDCERVALNMMGMIGAAMAGGFYYEAMMRARAETEAEKARRQAEQAELKAAMPPTPSAAGAVLRKEGAAPNDAARAWVEKFAEPLLKDVKTANEILEAIKCEPREKVPKLPSKETLMSWINGLRGELGLPKPRGGRPRKQGGST